MRFDRSCSFIRLVTGIRNVNGSASTEGTYDSAKSFSVSLVGRDSSQSCHLFVAQDHGPWISSVPSVGRSGLRSS